MAHSSIMALQALDDYDEARFQERSAKWKKKDILKLQITPNIIKLAHRTFSPRPPKKDMLSATSTIWQELKLQDEWLNPEAGGPTSSGPKDVEAPSMSDLLNDIFDASDALGWDMQD
ncbi:hypothetical protein BCR42DRAFT_415456 [Absidia repens]|uniref:Uncharacterized protein n=1 Tax=Absidia repens TaxID=90262 RepID=A0A1X2IHI7_9FUNG|nr:hypothetical protein BCR42DRAFT_415456 [Absidia repens]